MQGRATPDLEGEDHRVNRKRVGWILRLERRSAPKGATSRLMVSSLKIL